MAKRLVLVLAQALWLVNCHAGDVNGHLSVNADCDGARVPRPAQSFQLTNQLGIRQLGPQSQRLITAAAVLPPGPLPGLPWWQSNKWSW